MPSPPVPSCAERGQRLVRGHRPERESLTTLAYQRTLNLAKTASLTVPAAREQAEREVLTAFHIKSDDSFGSLDIGKGRDGDISSEPFYSY